jgi:hypothetical protein
MQCGVLFYIVMLPILLRGFEAMGSRAQELRQCCTAKLLHCLRLLVPPTVLLLQVQLCISAPVLMVFRTLSCGFAGVACAGWVNG